MRNATTVDPDLIDAVCKLVEALIRWHRESETDISDITIETTVFYVDAILRAIRAAPELSSLHGWADRQLAATKA
jgi:hypothetical protein